MKNVTFYGINGIGLGHMARLSVVQQYLAQHHPEIKLEAICRSSLGPSFFTCPCIKIDKTNRDLRKALGIRGMQGLLNLSLSSIFPSKRKVVVFDTSWSTRTLKNLRLGRHRPILILQSSNPEYMLETLKEDHKYFHKIFSLVNKKNLNIITRNTMLYGIYLSRKNLKRLAHLYDLPPVATTQKKSSLR
jgi:hypothetical protein